MLIPSANTEHSRQGSNNKHILKNIHDNTNGFLRKEDPGDFEQFLIDAPENYEETEFEATYEDP